MTLIIGVRCKDGCLVIADKRNRITENDVTRIEDNYSKVVIVSDYIVYNHGYNRINDIDWKQRAQDLIPDPGNQIYLNILNEMQAKKDQMAFYVFMNMTDLLEISIIVNEGIKLINHMPNEIIVSGIGSTYVDMVFLNKQLNNLKCRKRESVKKDLRKIFMYAHQNMKNHGGDEFSEEYEFTY